jgi:hypothetical protein
MTVQILTVNTDTDSFGQWIAKTNQIADTISYVTVTTNSNTTTGNASISGTFSANSLTVSNTGYFNIGSGVSNTVAAASSLVLQTSPTTNNVITSTGMVIDGVTSYTKNFMSIGTTTISGMDISTNSIHLVTALTLGNSIISNNNITSQNGNLVSLFVSNTNITGDVEANVQITRDGISIFANPSGMAVVNSFMNSTDLYINNIHANSVILNDPTRASTFLGNTVFNGANNYFLNGLNAANTSSFQNITVNGTATFNGIINVNSNTIFNGANNTFNNLQVINQLTAGVVNTPTINTKNIVISNDGGHTLTLSIPVAESSNYSLIWPSADGASGQVLATDGAGNLNWHTSTGDVNIDFTARSIGVGTPASGVPGELRAIGNITAYYSSDRNLKENITNISNALAKVQQLNGVEFDWTDDYINLLGGIDNFFTRKHDVGVIAQEIEQVMPEIVVTRDDGTKAVKYDRIVALLIEAIKDLKAEVDSLKNGH